MGNVHTVAAAQIVAEMANPLEVMVNVVYLIKQDPDNPIEVLKLALMAEGQLERMSQIVQRGLPRFMPPDGELTLV